MGTRFGGPPNVTPDAKRQTRSAGRPRRPSTLECKSNNGGSSPPDSKFPMRPSSAQSAFPTQRSEGPGRGTTGGHALEQRPTPMQDYLTALGMLCRAPCTHDEVAAALPGRPLTAAAWAALQAHPHVVRCGPAATTLTPALTPAPAPPLETAAGVGRPADLPLPPILPLAPETLTGAIGGLALPSIPPPPPLPKPEPEAVAVIPPALPAAQAHHDAAPFEFHSPHDLWQASAQLVTSLMRLPKDPDQDPSVSDSAILRKALRAGPAGAPLTSLVDPAVPALRDAQNVFSSVLIAVRRGLIKKGLAPAAGTRAPKAGRGKEDARLEDVPCVFAPMDAPLPPPTADPGGPGGCPSALPAPAGLLPMVDALLHSPPGPEGSKAPSPAVSVSAVRAAMCTGQGGDGAIASAAPAPVVPGLCVMGQVAMAVMAGGRMSAAQLQDVMPWLDTTEAGVAQSKRTASCLGHLVENRQCKTYVEGRCKVRFHVYAPHSPAQTSAVVRAALAPDCGSTPGAPPLPGQLDMPAEPGPPATPGEADGQGGGTGSMPVSLGPGYQFSALQARRAGELLALLDQRGAMSLLSLPGLVGPGSSLDGVDRKTLRRLVGLLGDRGRLVDLASHAAECHVVALPGLAVHSPEVTRAVSEAVEHLHHAPPRAAPPRPAKQPKTEQAEVPDAQARLSADRHQVLWAAYWRAANGCTAPEMVRARALHEHLVACVARLVGGDCSAPAGPLGSCKHSATAVLLRMALHCASLGFVCRILGVPGPLGADADSHMDTQVQDLPPHVLGTGLWTQILSRMAHLVEVLLHCGYVTIARTEDTPAAAAPSPKAEGPGGQAGGGRPGFYVTSTTLISVDFHCALVDTPAPSGTQSQDQGAAPALAPDPASRYDLHQPGQAEALWTDLRALARGKQPARLALPPAATRGRKVPPGWTQAPQLDRVSTRRLRAALAHLPARTLPPWEHGAAQPKVRSVPLAKVEPCAHTLLPPSVLPFDPDPACSWPPDVRFRCHLSPTPAVQVIAYMVHVHDPNFVASPVVPLAAAAWQGLNLLATCGGRLGVRKAELMAKRSKRAWSSARRANFARQAAERARQRERDATPRQPGRRARRSNIDFGSVPDLLTRAMRGTGARMPGTMAAHLRPYRELYLQRLALRPGQEKECCEETIQEALDPVQAALSKPINFLIPTASLLPQGPNMKQPNSLSPPSPASAVHAPSPTMDATGAADVAPVPSTGEGASCCPTSHPEAELRLRMVLLTPEDCYSQPAAEALLRDLPDDAILAGLSTLAKDGTVKMSAKLEGARIPRAVACPPQTEWLPEHSYTSLSEANVCGNLTTPEAGKTGPWHAVEQPDLNTVLSLIMSSAMNIAE
eukprot:gene4366-792_t